MQLFNNTNTLAVFCLSTVELSLACLHYSVEEGTLGWAWYKSVGENSAGNTLLWKETLHMVWFDTSISQKCSESVEVPFYDLVLLTSRIVGSHAPVQQISEGRFPMMDSSTTSFSQCKNKLLNKEYRPMRLVITHRVVCKCPACWSWCWVDPSEPWVWEVLPCQQFSFAFQQRMTYYSPSPLIYCTSPPSTVCCHLSSGSP
jgi:hypothetical protein